MRLLSLSEASIRPRAGRRQFELLSGNLVFQFRIPPSFPMLSPGARRRRGRSRGSSRGLRGRRRRVAYSTFNAGHFLYKQILKTLCRKSIFSNSPMSNATLRQTATYTCTKNVCLSILAAAALHGEEAGEAEDEEDELTDHCGCGEAQVGTGAFILSISLNAENKLLIVTFNIWHRYSRQWSVRAVPFSPTDPL